MLRSLTPDALLMSASQSRTHFPRRENGPGTLPGARGWGPAPSSSRRVPTGIGPEFAADRRVGDQEADGVGDFLRPNQSAQLGIGEDVLVDELLAQGPD